MTAWLSWLGTYAVHSTILLLAALLAARVMGPRRLQLQEAVLRVAFVGGLITASVQGATGVTPFAGVVSLSGAAPPPPTAASGAQANVVPLERVAGRDMAAPLSSAGFDAGLGLLHGGWRPALLLVWAVGVALGLLRLAGGHRRLRQLVKDRRSFPEGRRLRLMALALGLRRSFLLSACARLVVPFATGIRTPEVCLPERALVDLDRRQRDALIAHELAHLARRDPLWLLVYRLLESVLFFQPLNRVARRRLEQIAEHLSDDRAVECTGNPVDLARCLVEVTGWAAAGARPLPVAGAVSTRGGLSLRVDRILAGSAGRRSSPRWMAVACSLILLPASLCLPAVGSVMATPEETPATSTTERDFPTPEPVAENGSTTSEPTSPALPDVTHLEKEAQRLGELAQRYAEQVSRYAEQTRHLDQEQRRALEAQLAELRAHLHELTARMRLSGEDKDLLHEQARELAEEQRLAARLERDEARRQARERGDRERSESIRRERLAREEALQRARARELKVRERVRDRADERLLSRTERDEARRLAREQARQSARARERDARERARVEDEEIRRRIEERLARERTALKAQRREAEAKARIEEERRAAELEAQVEQELQQEREDQDAPPPRQ